jgi:hypothetical protein
MNEVNKPEKLAGCVAASCPAVYQDNDSYLLVGEHKADQAVPQTVSDDETVIAISKSLIEEAKA